jgi:PAS domain S-box-containing protein
MWANIKAQKNLVIETFHSNKEGETIPVEVYVNHLVFEEKEYICTSLRDLRERFKKTQPQRLAQFTLENNPIMVYWIEKTGKVFYANKIARETLGYTKEEITKKHIMELTGSYPDIKMWNARWRIMKEENNKAYEGSNITKSGRKFPVEIRRHYINYEGKELICVFVSDISERKKQEKALQDTLNETISQSSNLTKEVTTLRREMKTTSGLSSIITNSDKYLRVLTQVRRVAETQATVLITGETGTGKELLAKAVHELSERSNEPLIKVNAAVIPENLFESELFGHEKGAFTGAVQSREGRFEAADGGTIFLDEIGEMPVDLQAKLLRVLQEGEFERVGGSKTIKVNVRVVAATNRNLEEMVGEGKFREDLYYRLNVFPVHNLPLRERKEDIPLLIDFFLKKYARKVGKNVKEVPKASLNELMKYEFPGNVRELENMVERALILSSTEYLNLDTILKSGIMKKKKRSGKFQTLDEMQRTYIIKAIKRCNGRISGKDGAAIILGLNDKTLYSRIKKLGIKKTEYLA